LLWEGHEVNERNPIVALVRFIYRVGLVLGNRIHKLGNGLLDRFQFCFLDFVAYDLAYHGYLSLHMWRLGANAVPFACLNECLEPGADEVLPPLAVILLSLFGHLAYGLVRQSQDGRIPLRFELK
jgi:hypothetical protein